VGKGILARWLHQNGPSANGAFVDLNCAGLSRELLESELFGHERGAFTGAVSRKLGLLEVAHRGTLFLDEIGELDLTVQAKLLKVLEERRFRRVGDVRDRLVAVRFVAATHRDLRELVSQQRFRSDLYFRISAIPLEVPPLRERREDIGILANALLQRSALDLGRADQMSLSPRALEALVRYSWPGNIRELRNVMERAVLLSEGQVVDSSLLQFREAPSEQESSGTHLTLVAMERLHIERVLNDCEGHVDEAAKILQIPRSSLYQKIKKLGIVFPKSRRVVS
jgi:transcriptional regulator with PAS, ATPase and Fis domain